MSTQENPYLRDASEFLRPALRIIAEGKSGIDLYNLVIFSAFGIERLLKGLLWRRNPVFVLSDTSFKNAAPIIYSNKMRQSALKANSEITKEPDEDVVSFRTSILRADLFSPAVSKHKGALFKLSRFRDIVAHRDLNELLSGKAGAVWPLLFGGIFPLLRDLEAEGLMKIADFSEGKEEKLRLVSIDYTEDVAARVEKRLQLHREVWEHRTAQEKEAIAKSKPSHTMPEEWDQDVDCPACDNRAYVRYKVDFDIVDREAVAIGTIAEYFHCPWCNLHVGDYEELQVLDIPISGNDLQNDSWESAY
jgi:hypothetical protein